MTRSDSPPTQRFAAAVGVQPPKRWDRGAALTSTLHWLETELRTREENLVGLMAPIDTLPDASPRPRRGSRDA